MALIDLYADYFFDTWYRNPFTLPYDFLSDIFFSLLYYKDIIYIMHITYKIYVNQLLILSVRLPVKSGLSVATFLGALGGHCP